MSKLLEQLKKIINEQEAALIIKGIQQQQQLSFLEQQAFEKLQIKLIDEEGLTQLPSVDTLQQLYQKPSKSFEAQSATDESLTKIFANFSKEFGQKNIQDGGLHFPGDHDNSKADAFFKTQATEGHAFLFQQVNCDNYAFSDGIGHYKMGTKTDIIAYCQKNSIEVPGVFNEENDEHSSSMRQSF